MTAKKEFILNIIGLKIGTHQYSFTISDVFFDDFEHSIVKEGNVEVNLSLEKKSEVFFTADFSWKGAINLTCDRCLDTYDYPITSQYQLFIKLSDKHVDVEGDIDDDDVVFLPLLAQQFDVAPIIYELINLSVPLQSKCDLIEKSCNEEMLKRIDNYNLPDSEDGNNIDPRWEGLQNLN
jgi:uncharacterized metal-binding protein YceD (DUF177 family)